MADRDVTVSLRASVSGFVAGIRTAQAQVKGFNDSLEKSFAKRRALNELGTAAGVMGAAAAAGLGFAIKAAADFDQAMSNVEATGKDAARNMDGLREAAMKAGADTQFSATEAAQGIENLLKAGVKAKDVMAGGLTGALNLAAAGQIEVADAAEIAATAMTQFNLKGKDVPHIADLLAAGAGKAQGEVTDMAMALKRGGLVASNVGLTIEETTGTLAAFASAGLLGSDAGTSLKAMFLRLQNPASGTAELMQELGISLYDAKGNFVGMGNLAGELEDALKGMTQEQRDSTLATIFGSDAVRAATVLYKEGEKGIDGWVKKVNDQGYAADAAATKMDNLSGDFEQLKGSLETALIGTGEGAQGPLRNFVQGLTSLTNTYNAMPEPVKKIVAAALFGGAVLGGGAFVATRLISGVASLKENLHSLGITSGQATTGMQKAKIAARGLAGIAGMGLLLHATTQTNEKMRVFENVAGGALMGFSAGGPWGAAIGAGVGGLITLQEAFGDLDAKAAASDAKVDMLTKSFTRLGASVTRATRKIVIHNLEQDGVLEIAEKAGISTELLVKAILHGGRAYDKLDAAMVRVTESGRLNEEEADKLFNSYFDQQTAVNAAHDAHVRENNALGHEVKTLKQLTSNQTRASETAKNLGNWIKFLEDKTRKQTGSSELDVKTLNRLADKFSLNQVETRQLIRDYNDLRNGTQRNTLAHDNLDRQLQKVAKQLGLNTTDSDKLSDKLWAQTRANIALTGKGKLTEDQLRAIGERMGLTRQKTQDLIEKYNDVPKDVKTTAHFEDNKARSDLSSFVSWGSAQWDRMTKGWGDIKEPAELGVPGRAQGGLMDGPGTKTSDSILARLSRGEFVQRAAAVEREGVPAMRALNEGRATIVPAFAQGGMPMVTADRRPEMTPFGWLAAIPDIRQIVRMKQWRQWIKSMNMSGDVSGAIRWARKQVGDDYQLGGVGPNVWDCSGFMSGITNFLMKTPLHVRRGSTADFPWPGFAPGPDPRGFTIGSTPSYPGSGYGHMAGTLGGVNVESAGGVGVRVGPSARGYRDPGFTQVYHLRGIKYASRGGGGDIGALSDAEKWIIRHEGGSLRAVRADNPFSTAWGVGQLTEENRVKYARQLGYPVGIERGDEGTTNRDHQIAMMRSYIRDRYGTAERAKAFHQSAGYYDRGGLLPPGVTMAINRTGKNEHVLTSEQYHARRNRSSVPVTLEIDGHQVTGVLRGIAREEVEDEMAYQAGG